MAAALAVDNDVLLKALSYGLEESFWPSGRPEEIGVLGAARYVLGDRLARVTLRRDERREALCALLDRTEALEPDKGEIDLAAQIEKRAAELGLELDGGESQLAAMVSRRGMELLETGDKRAIAGLESLVAEIGDLKALCGRVRCLEQIAHRVASDDFAAVSSAICAEAEVDKSLSVCFNCHSDSMPGKAAVLEVLCQYIEDVRQRAPSVLEPGP